MKKHKYKHTFQSSTCLVFVHCAHIVFSCSVFLIVPDVFVCLSHSVIVPLTWVCRIGLQHVFVWHLFNEYCFRSTCRSQRLLTIWVILSYIVYVDSSILLRLPVFQYNQPYPIEHWTKWYYLWNAAGWLIFYTALTPKTRIKMIQLVV